MAVDQRLRLLRRSGAGSQGEKAGRRVSIRKPARPETIGEDLRIIVPEVLANPRDHRVALRLKPSRVRRRAQHRRDTSPGPGPHAAPAVGGNGFGVERARVSPEYRWVVD